MNITISSVSVTRWGDWVVTGYYAGNKFYAGMVLNHFAVRTPSGEYGLTERSCRRMTAAVKRVAVKMATKITCQFPTPIEPFVDFVSDYIGAHPDSDVTTLELVKLYNEAKQ